MSLDEAAKGKDVFSSAMIKCDVLFNTCNDDILLYIFSYLQPLDLIKVSAVTKTVEQYC